MKKNYFYLAAATLLLAGCAQDSFVDDNLQETTVPQEIKMSAGNRGISVGGRGIGSVGTGTNEDQWNGETIKIYAFNKNLTNFGTENEQNVYLNGATATVASNNSVQFVNNGVGVTEYYPLQGAFRFVGYHTDDATLGTPVATATDLTIPVTITGSQDVMIAKAELTTADKMNLFDAMVAKDAFNGAAQNTLVDNDYNPIAGGTFETTIKNEYEKAFSSYTARRDVQPNLVFTHQLVRLNFYVKAGDNFTIAKTEDYTGNNGPATRKRGVYIKGIEVFSHYEGQIVIEKSGDISFTDKLEPEKGLFVGSRGDNNQITTLAQTGNIEADATATPAKATKVGEGILVMLPTNELTNADQSITKYYTANIKTIQFYDQNAVEITDETKQNRTYENVKIQKPQVWNATDQKYETKEFEAGKSYDITITVYSNQSINVTATLTGWVDGGSIEINPEDEYFNSSNSGSSNND